jgi:hypothetical protein
MVSATHIIEICQHTGDFVRVQYPSKYSLTTNIQKNICVVEKGNSLTANGSKDLQHFTLLKNLTMALPMVSKRHKMENHMIEIVLARCNSMITADLAL